jgi:hypothetical protein
MRVRLRNQQSGPAMACGKRRCNLGQAPLVRQPMVVLRFGAAMPFRGQLDAHMRALPGFGNWRRARRLGRRTAELVEIMIAMKVSAAARPAVMCCGLMRASLRAAPAARSVPDKAGQIVGGEPSKLDSRYTSSPPAVVAAAGSARRSLAVVSSGAAEWTVSGGTFLSGGTSFGSSSNRHDVLSDFSGAGPGALAVLGATSLRDGRVFALA